MPTANDIVTVTVRLPTKLLRALEELMARKDEDEFRTPSRNALICRAITEHVRAERRRASR